MKGEGAVGLWLKFRAGGNEGEHGIKLWRKKIK
jgi:hypothetical protein